MAMASFAGPERPVLLLDITVGWGPVPGSVDDEIFEVVEVIEEIAISGDVIVIEGFLVIVVSEKVVAIVVSGGAVLVENVLVDVASEGFVVFVSSRGAVVFVSSRGGVVFVFSVVTGGVAVVDGGGEVSEMAKSSGFHRMGIACA